MRIIGFDPGLRFTGWGVIENVGNAITYIASGVISVKEKQELAIRIAEIHKEATKIIKEYNPEQAAVEETFVNKNPLTTLRLGQARGAVLLAPALLEIPVFEYSPNLIKKTVVGTGHAEKNQIQTMIKHLLPKSNETNPDANDALAVCVCHAYHGFSRKLNSM